MLRANQLSMILWSLFFSFLLVGCNGSDDDNSEFVDSSSLVVQRTTEQITLVETRTLNMNGSSFELNFYRNEAYTCGLSGNYTFFVMEATDNPSAEAPLWAYLHGGGYGWFDEDQVYQAVKTMTQDTFNHEETFDDLIDDHLLHNTMRNDEVMDSTLTRRIQEGYRVLLVSMCDHDNYSGRGTPYPNNPNGEERQVNGLQATMAAMDYTVANYPTTHVFAHGTSAGSIGAFAMSHAYAEEGTYLTAIVADSWQYTRRTFDMFDALVGQEGYVWNEGADLRTDGMDKIGFDYLGQGIYPEAVIEGGFVEVPSMYIIGEKDPGCGGYRDGILPTIPEAEAEDLSNCAWQYDSLREAIANQPNSPHVFDLSPSGDHVETNRSNTVNDRVDTFIGNILENNPPYPFPLENAAGFNTLLMGHSFFRPIAEELPFHAAMAGIVGHTQTVEFSGGASGAPMALWEDEDQRNTIQAVLDTGEIELFGMTYEGTYPTLDGYILWIDYALSKNPNTQFFIGLPWPDFPADYANAESYAALWDYEGQWLPFIDSLRALYPGVDIFSIPYGQAAIELRTLYEAGNLPDVSSMTGDADDSIFVDTKGHGGDILHDLAELIWLNAIYGVDLDTYAYDRAYQTDLKAIAKSIMDAHDPTYNIQSSVAPSDDSTTTTHHITVDNRKREFIVYVPESVRADAPVIFVIHGTGNNGQVFYDNTDWTSKADDEGIIAVFPSSLTYCYYNEGDVQVKTKWASGSLGKPDGFPLCSADDVAALTANQQALIENSVADDLAFFDSMLSFIEANYSIDNKRYYLTGNSNGASMTLRLAAERSTRFASATANAGSLQLSLPAAENPLSTMLTVGSNDNFLSEATEESTPIQIREDLIFSPLLYASLQNQLSAQSLSDSYTYTEYTQQGTLFSRYLFDESFVGENIVGASNQFEFIVIDGRGHSYPNEAIDHYWDFMSAEALP